jgi:hypothetical protein
MEIFRTIAEWGILVTGLFAAFLVSRTEHWKRWGYIIGLSGQPFWLYVAYINEQWSIIVLSCVYTYTWSQGIYFYWVKPWRQSKKNLF